MSDCIHDIEEAWCGLCSPAAGPESPLESWVTAVSLLISGDGMAPDRISHDDLVTASGLTPHQVDRAVAAIRERHPDLPLISDRTGIRFTMDADAVRRFRNTAARVARTRIRRAFRGGLLPWLQASGASENDIRRIGRQFDRILEDIEDLIDANHGALTR